VRVTTPGLLQGEGSVFLREIYNIRERRQETILAKAKLKRFFEGFAKKHRAKGGFSFSYSGCYDSRRFSWVEGMEIVGGPDVILKLDWFWRDWHIMQKLKPTDIDRVMTIDIVNKILPTLEAINSFTKPMRVIINCENKMQAEHNEYYKKRKLLSKIGYLIVRVPITKIPRVLFGLDANFSFHMSFA